jgi:hypothetical protein
VTCSQHLLSEFHAFHDHQDRSLAPRGMSVVG